MIVNWVSSGFRQLVGQRCLFLSVWILLIKLIQVMNQFFGFLFKSGVFHPVHLSPRLYGMQERFLKLRPGDELIMKIITHCNVLEINSSPNRRIKSDITVCKQIRCIVITVSVICTIYWFKDFFSFSCRSLRDHHLWRREGSFTSSQGHTVPKLWHQRPVLPQETQGGHPHRGELSLPAVIPLWDGTLRAAHDGYNQNAAAQVLWMVTVSLQKDRTTYLRRGFTSMFSCASVAKPTDVAKGSNSVCIINS